MKEGTTERSAPHGLSTVGVIAREQRDNAGVAARFHICRPQLSATCERADPVFCLGWPAMSWRPVAPRAALLAYRSLGGHGR